MVARENSANQKRSESIKVALAFIAIYLVWGSTYLAIRYAVETIPPLVTAGIRHTIAGGMGTSTGWEYERRGNLGPPLLLCRFWDRIANGSS